MTEQLYSCPYDIAHQIRGSRFGPHLLRCRKNHPGVKVCKCPYNACHVVLPEDYEEHLKTCEGRIYAERAELRTLQNPICTEQRLVETDDSDWGSGPDTTRESEKAHLERILHTPVVRIPSPGMNQTYKRHFREAEINRVSLLTENKSILDVEYPKKYGGFETIANMLRRLEISKSPAKTADTSVGSLETTNKNIMKTAQPLQSKYLPGGVVQSNISDCVIEGATGSSNNQKLTKGKGPKPKANGNNVQTTNQIGVKAPLSTTSKRHNAGYGRGSHRGENNNDNAVGGLKKKDNHEA